MKKITHHMSLLQQLIAVLLAVIIIPIFIIGLLATTVSSKALEEQSENAKMALAAQTSLMIDQEIQGINQLFLQLSIAPSFQEVVHHLVQPEGLSQREEAKWQLERMKLLGTFEKELQSVAISNDYINNVSLMFITGDLLGTNDDFRANVGDIRKTKTYKEVMSASELVTNRQKPEDILINNNFMIVSKSIKNFGYSNSEPVAGAMAILNYKEFQSMLANIKIGIEDQSYIITPSGGLISALTFERSMLLGQETIFKEIEIRSQTVDADTFKWLVDDVSTIVTYNRCDDSGYIYVILMAEKEVLKGSITIRNIIVTVGLSFTIIAVISGTIFAYGMANELRKVVMTMAEAAKGNLNVKCKVVRKDEIGELGYAFNEMVQHIKELIDESKLVLSGIGETSTMVTVVSEEASHVASEIAMAINEVAEGANLQSEEVDRSLITFVSLANDIHQVVEETAYMASSSKEVKDSTKSGLIVAEKLDRKVCEVNQITTKLVNQIKDLEVSIISINDITEILNNITEQTRLLSLNASIEAARAGIHGRGFMVVADEIRQLANQSSQQTKEIDVLVNALLHKASDSTNLVMNADLAIKEQGEAIKESSELYGLIDDATDQLQSNILQINGRIQQVDESKEEVLLSINRIFEVSEMSASAAEEVSASTEEQLSSLEELNEMILTLDKSVDQLSQSLRAFKV